MKTLAYIIITAVIVNLSAINILEKQAQVKANEQEINTKRTNELLLRLAEDRRKQEEKVNKEFAEIDKALTRQAEIYLKPLPKDNFVYTEPSYVKPLY